ncbi:FAD-binding protein [Nocardia sp. NPDC003345]
MHRIPAAFPSTLLGAGQPLTLRGAGHSCGGQTITDGDLLVAYSSGSAMHRIRDLGDGLVEVPADMSWYDLERTLNRHGLSVPVLPDYLRMSVGGTLSVGAVGIDSIRRGMQPDHVERIQLTDGTGRSRWCSRTEHPELFRFALGGLGTVGLIERAVLRCAPYLRFTHLHRTFHATARELAEFTESVAQREDVDTYSAFWRDGVFSSVTGWRANDRTGCHDRPDCIVARNRPAAGHADARPHPASTDEVRLWTDFVVPSTQFVAMLTAVEKTRQHTPLGSFLTMLYILVIRRPAAATPFAFAAAGQAPLSIGLGVYTSVPRDSRAIASVRAVFRRLLERCHDLGGRPYLYGANELDDPLARRLYGADLDKLARLRASHRLEHVNAHLPIVTAGTPAQRSGGRDDGSDRDS